MESFYAHSFSARAKFEVRTTQEGNKLVAEKPAPKVQGPDEETRRPGPPESPLESELRPEEKPAGKKELAKDLRGPDRGLRRLLWLLAEAILGKEMALRREYSRQATKEVSGLRVEGLRVLIKHLEMILRRVLRAIIMPILRLALIEYKESFSDLLSQGGNEIDETAQQEYIDEAVSSVTDMPGLDYRPPREES